MTKTIIISNRLPVDLKIKAKKIEVRPSVGGLATGLSTVHRQGKSIWIGWPGLTIEEIGTVYKEKIKEALKPLNCVAVQLSDKDVSGYYFGFSNKSLWPLFHYFLEYTEYQPEQWTTYKEVNEKFAETVLNNCNDGDTIWIHDYQLLLLPKILRDRNPTLTIGFFLHIPFPAFEIFRTCPWRKELLQGMLGANLIGFHTYDYAQHFLNSAKRIVDIQLHFNEITYDNRTIKVDSFPMGIDYYHFYNTALDHLKGKYIKKSDLKQHLMEYRNNHPDRKMILSIDRMDYTKGIPNRIHAFGYFLEKYPQYIGKVRLVMLSVPSRANVPQYRKLKKETDELVGRINGKFATIDWTPIWYFYRSMPFENLIDLYTNAQVALITPLRDGMNLVAKEYIATRTKKDGVLILSEMAGAASEMQEAILVNPNNADQIAEALHTALEMPLKEQIVRMEVLQSRLSKYTVEKWASDFMKQLNDSSIPKVLNSPSELLDRTALEKMKLKFKTAPNRLFLLDYDGTLVHFKLNPENAIPDQKLYELLDGINKNNNTEVAIISGRSRRSLAKYFAHKKYTLITDHGIWIRKIDEEWKKIENPKTEWKDSIRPIIVCFVDKTPGSFLEEKEFSLAWHYRKAEAHLAEIRMRELRIVLSGLVTDSELSILNGNKVLEVKNSIVSKGRAITNLDLDADNFIFVAGDDYTDESMFEMLPPNAISIKVGNTETLAKYHVQNILALRNLLKNFESQ
ncbi:bifunctional alpha,alpha-trehalose-phosphate synthase (UDP-forming)/trehalose-phosphatase [Flavobacterium daejeonense]|uniref:bifunctional alpha,alpha-trehalose-phosphate synthase (UDP-forming)/trehalose-phosphatase n=1 Tax=Flavobacterium daejeonense TaxID=350893 RepID=UPI00047D1A3B|nr:bifunctional alpha,alpha-trehalose-phosphate synthase (UDP-forming)/trehalose-phosphatase [Flavobacterium daejeonense]